MSSTRKDDGGPAFSGEAIRYEAGYATRERFPVPGMSLRDYFAAKAMHADLVYQGLEGREDLGHVAAMAYEMADAMLKERAK